MRHSTWLRHHETNRLIDVLKLRAPIVCTVSFFYVCEFASKPLRRTKSIIILKLFSLNYFSCDRKLEALLNLLREFTTKKFKRIFLKKPLTFKLNSSNELKFKISLGETLFLAFNFYFLKSIVHTGLHIPRSSLKIKFLNVFKMS